MRSKKNGRWGIQNCNQKQQKRDLQQKQPSHFFGGGKAACVFVCGAADKKKSKVDSTPEPWLQAKIQRGHEPTKKPQTLPKGFR